MSFPILRVAWPHSRLIRPPIKNPWRHPSHRAYLPARARCMMKKFVLDFRDLADTRLMRSRELAQTMTANMMQRKVSCSTCRTDEHVGNMRRGIIGDDKVDTVGTADKINRTCSARRTRGNTASSAAGGGFDGTERAGTRSDGRKHGRSSSDGCGEDRAPRPHMGGCHPLQVVFLFCTPYSSQQISEIWHNCFSTFLHRFYKNKYH